MIGDSIASLSSAERPPSMVGDAPGRVLLFWDYDTQWGTNPRRPQPSTAFANLGHLEFACTDRLLELHDRYGIPACFAAVGAAGLPGARPYHDPTQIRRIHEAGHEIASHSFHHEWLPALSRPALRATLHRSKEALEQCIGAPVVSFVPPYNQPFDHAAGWSFSLSERRAVKTDRTDLRRLCEELRETGHRFCRVAYRPLSLRLMERVLHRDLQYPRRLESISGVTCVRLGVCGFDGAAVALLERCADSGGIAVIYGHPHSLDSGNAQDEAWLSPFLARVDQLRRQGRVKPCLPRELLVGV